MEYDFEKSHVTGPWDHKVSVSAKKVKKKFHACVPLKHYHQLIDRFPKAFMLSPPPQSNHQRYSH
jgi:hypothetical protein